MYNLFSKKTEKNKISVSISIDTDDNVNIEYKYNSNELGVEDKMSKLLYSINNGLLTTHFVQFLLKEPNIIFASSVIDKWYSFNTINNNTTDSEPVIKPINAFAKNVK